MSRFLDLFPKTIYDINKTTGTYSNFDLVTNITFRFGILKDVLKNVTSYYNYSIHDGDRPEIIAEKVYGDTEAYWIILYANDIYDPQYDWPMNYDTFKNYINNKYGSVAWAQTNYHHYEKIITRVESFTGVTTTQRFVVDYNKLTTNSFANYDYYLGLPDNAVSVIDTDGQTITETISKAAVSYYDYEDELNESKRLIKIIKPEYYTQIRKEFDNLTGNAVNPFLRKFSTQPFTSG